MDNFRIILSKRQYPCSKCGKDVLSEKESKIWLTLDKDSGKVQDAYCFCKQCRDEIDVMYSNGITGEGVLVDFLKNPIGTMFELTNIIELLAKGGATETATKKLNEILEAASDYFLRDFTEEDCIEINKR